VIGATVLAVFSIDSNFIIRKLFKDSY